MPSSSSSSSSSNWVASGQRFHWFSKGFIWFSNGFLNVEALRHTFQRSYLSDSKWKENARYPTSQCSIEQWSSTYLTVFILLDVLSELIRTERSICVSEQPECLFYSLQFVPALWNPKANKRIWMKFHEIPVIPIKNHSSHALVRPLRQGSKSSIGSAEGPKDDEDPDKPKDGGPLDENILEGARIESRNFIHSQILRKPDVGSEPRVVQLAFCRKQIRKLKKPKRRSFLALRDQ